MAKAKKSLVEFGSCETTAHGNLLSAGRFDIDGKTFYSGKLEVMGATISLSLEPDAIAPLQHHIGKRIQVSGKLLAKNENKELKFQTVDLIQDQRGLTIWEEVALESDDDSPVIVEKPTSPFAQKV